MLMTVKTRHHSFALKLKKVTLACKEKQRRSAASEFTSQFYKLYKVIMLIYKM